MGISPFGKSCYLTEVKSCNCNCDPVVERKLVNANPDPKNYKITVSMQYDNAFVLFVNYPNCVNYEGNKIIVFDGNLDDYFDHFKENGIDPHFEKSKYSPIARFVPTSDGFKLACKFAESFNP